MKKFLMAVLFLIPVIVVIALNATGQIIALTTPVNPSSIMVKNSSNKELTRTDVITVDINETEEFIIIDVLPTIAKNRAINEPEIDEEAGDGEVKLEQIDNTNRYRILPQKVGVTKLILTANGNVNAMTTLTINVTSNSLTSLDVYDGQGNVIGEDQIVYLTDTTKFYADAYPISAVTNAGVEWEIRNGDCISVDKNGEVRIQDVGIVQLRVKADDKDGNTLTRDITLSSEKAVLKSSVAYTSSAVSAEWVRLNLALYPEDTVVEKTGEVYTATYTNPDDGSDVRVAKVKVTEVSEDEWAIDSDDGVVYVNSGIYYVEAKRLESGETLNAKFTSSNNNVLYVNEEGVLMPISVGEATITASFDGQTRTANYVVRDNPIAFELSLSTEDAKRGVNLSRVWAFNWLGEGNSIKNSYDLYLENDVGAYDLEWSVSNTDYAEFVSHANDEGVTINFKEAVCGNSVTLTANVVVHGRKTRVRRSFTFNFREEKDAINVYDINQLKYVVDSRRTAAVFQSDIYPTEKLSFGMSMYGNGFTYHGESLGLDGNDPNNMNADILYIKDDYVPLNPDGTPVKEEVVLEDFIVQGAESIEEAKNKGNCIYISDVKKVKLKFKHLQLKNAHRCIMSGATKDLTLEGCILGDVYETCIFTFYPPDKNRVEEFGSLDYPKITLKNNVFKTSLCPSVMLTAGDMEEAFNDNVTPHLSIEGFMDVYNWKVADEFGGSLVELIFAALGVSGSGDNSGIVMLKDIVGGVFNDWLATDAFRGVVYTYNNVDYVSMGVFGLGTMFIANTDLVNIDENSGVCLSKLPLAYEDEDGELVPYVDAIAGVNDIIIKFVFGLNTAEYNIYNDSFLIYNDFTQGEPEISPGDPVPNSYELYARLRGEK